ncbi:MAG TPA: hypothetical protein G4O00_14635 [Thermoflexia bacterium]|nr:hypothetical protein [Thermoflexia bacterium]
MRRRIGCGLWLVFFLAALFAAEWVLLWLVVRTVPQDRLVHAVFGVIAATIVGGWIAVYLRMERRSR